MPRDLPKGVSVDRDRHGNVRLYFRTAGRPKVRLQESPGSREFQAEVAAARLGVPYLKARASESGEPAPRRATEIEGSLDWLIAQYRVRAKHNMAPDQLARRVRLLEGIANSKHKDRRRGSLPFALLERKHIIEIRDEIAETPGAQNNLVKYVSAMFGWATDVGLAKINPALRIKDLHSGDGFHAWTVEEVAKYDATFPLGTTARLVKDIALFTGLRRDGVAIFGRQHVKSGWIRITPGKTKKSSGVTVEIPVLAPLAASIAATKTGDLTFIQNEKGNAFTANGLGNKFRDWCDAAGLPHCSMHGLRKAGATIAAEQGATDDQLMAIFGWTTKKQTTLYTRSANRKRMAGAAAHLLMPEQKMDEIVPPAKGFGKSETKRAKNA